MKRKIRCARCNRVLHEGEWIYSRFTRNHYCRSRSWTATHAADTGRSLVDKPWKRNEREKCRALGGQRRGPTGRDLDDCEGVALVSLEAKLYARLLFKEEDFEQAKRNAAKVGRIPVLSVKERGRGGRDRVVMDWDDFLFLFELAKSNYVGLYPFNREAA